MTISTGFFGRPEDTEPPIEGTQFVTADLMTEERLAVQQMVDTVTEINTVTIPQINSDLDAIQGEFDEIDTKVAAAQTSATASAVSASQSASSATISQSAASTATTANNSAQTAAASAAANAGSSAASAAEALTSQNAAGASATAASASAASAATAKTAAEAAQAAAVTAKTASETARDQAVTAKNAAQSSQTAAAVSETNAAAYELSANNWATKTSGPVAGGEYSAKYHAQQAATSSSSASSSATSASSSASAASTSAANAAVSAATANTKASEASTSATNAASSASAASTSATNAASSASSASTSASTATTKASEASTSATNAAASATTATTKASEASTSATNAASSASAAASSATSAATAKTAAEAAQAAAETVYDNFDDRYLGSKASNPTVDNDGNALITGALYFNTTASEMRVYNGSSWLAAYIPATGYVQKSGDTMTGNLNFSGNGLRITGDFSNAAVANRLMFQTNTSNSYTVIRAIPSGTGNYAEIGVGNNSDQSAATSTGFLSVSTSEVRLSSNQANGGTLLPLTFHTSGAERVRIDTSGNTGIGTSSPNKSSSSKALTVNAGAGAFSALELSAGDSPVWYINSNGATTYDVTVGNQPRATWVNGAERMRVQSNGNIIVGNAANETNGLRFFDLYNQDTGASAGTIYRMVTSNAAGTGVVTGEFIKYKFGGMYLNNTETDAAAFTSFGVNGEKMRLTSAGRLGIGTTVPTAVINTLKTTAGNATDNIWQQTFDGNWGVTFNQQHVYGSHIQWNWVDASNNKLLSWKLGNTGIGADDPKARLQVSSGAVKNAPTLGSVTNAPLYVTAPDAAFGLAVGTNNVDGHVWFQAQRSDANTAVHPITLNEAGGNVGIGLASPEAKLHLAGNDVQLRFTNGGSHKRHIAVVDADNSMRFTRTGVADDLAIDNAGNVGIGTLSITQKLTVSGNGLFTGNVDATNITGTGYSFRARANAGDTQGGLIQFTNNAATGQWAGITSPSSNQLVFYNGGGTELGRFNNTSFCVGTTSADGRVSVTSAGSTAAWQVRVNSSGVGNDSGIYMDASNHMMLVARNGSGGETIAMRSAGTSWVNGGKFLINATSTFDGVSDAQQQIYTTGNAPLALKVNGGGPGTFVSFFDNSGGRIGWIGFSSATTSFNTTSDYRLKENVAPLSDGLARINALRPVTYTWKTGGQQGEGFIAHEVGDHIPLAVSGSKDAVNRDGSINPQGLDYSKMIVHLVSAVQELSAKLDAAEARIAQLEGAA